MAYSQLSDSVETSLANLRAARTEKQRADGATLLRGAVVTAARELSPEMFKFFEESVFRRVFDLSHSSEVPEKRSAVAAINALIDVVSGGVERKTIKLANTLKHMITANSDRDLLAEVASALSHLVRSSREASEQESDFVEFELGRSLEWLLAEPRYGHRRLAACLVLRELSRSSPSLFYKKAPLFFERIWPLLREPNQRIRDAAAGAMDGALAVLTTKPMDSVG